MEGKGSLGAVAGMSGRVVKDRHVPAVLLVPEGMMSAVRA
jgi:hypothetical protein